MTAADARRAIAVARNRLEDLVGSDDAGDQAIGLALELGRAMAELARVECATWHEGCAFCAHQLRDRSAPESHGERRTGGLR